MAYVPSLADLPQTEASSQGYAPTLADLERLQTAQPSQSAVNFVKEHPRISQALAAANPVLAKLANNPVTNFVLGAGDAARFTLNNAANLAPGVNLPNNPSVSGSPLSYTLGKVAGDIGTFIGGGAGLNAVRGAAEALPIAGRAMQAIGGNGFLPGLARRAIGSAGYGALMEPDDRAMGAVKGAGFSAGFDMLPGVGKLIGRATNAIRPQKYADELIQNIGSGKSLESNAKSLAEDIKSAYQKRQNESSQLYQPVFDVLGNRSVYSQLPSKTIREPVNNFKNIDEALDSVNDTLPWTEELSNAADLKEHLFNTYGYVFNNNKQMLNFFNSVPKEVKTGSYNRINPDLINNFGVDAKNLHQGYLDNPIFRNAHELQSQLGSEIRQLSKNTAPDVATRNAIQSYKIAQDAIKRDINTFLGAESPELASQYSRASQHFAEHVSPYRDSKKILDIATENITNPRNISTLFKNPEPEIEKIIGDLPANASYRILYNELGKPAASSKPENLLKAYENLDKQGLGSYVTPELANKMDTLARRVTNRNFAQRGTGLIGGALAARMIPGAEAMPVIAEGVGAMIGSLGAPKAMQAIQRILPQSAGGFSRELGNAYDLSAKAALANLLAGGQ